ncbi:MAG: hypothetical protein NUV56_03755 [Candidatus Uhrbacteria bacterium]|nr:hypothetical protein [Candidatus Uhrbacteria bacterium]
MFRFRLLGLSIGVVMLFTCFVSRAQAIAVLPESIDVQVGLKASTSITLSIGNDSSHDAVVDISTRLVNFAEDGSLLFDEASPFWAELSVTELPISARDAADINVTITTDGTIDPGAYAFAVIAKERPLNTTEIGFATAYASLVFVAVGEPGVARAACEDFLIEKNGRDLSLSSAIANDGGGILYVATSVDISAMGDVRTVSTSVQAFHRILPGQTRDLTWDIRLPWWMVGPARVNVHELACDGATVFLLSSLSMAAAFIIVFGAPIGAILLWRKRHR